jgi:hypothetical protein
VSISYDTAAWISAVAGVGAAVLASLILFPIISRRGAARGRERPDSKVFFGGGA